TFTGSGASLAASAPVLRGGLDLADGTDGTYSLAQDILRRDPGAIAGATAALQAGIGELNDLRAKIQQNQPGTADLLPVADDVLRALGQQLTAPYADS